MAPVDETKMDVEMFEDSKTPDVEILEIDEESEKRYVNEIYL